MKYIRFEWDDQKNESNLRKHGLQFNDILSVFEDNNAILFDDPEHSIGEERFIIIGMSLKMGICLVCHCYKSNDEIIRIISARKATKHEIRQYYEGL